MCFFRKSLLHWSKPSEVLRVLYLQRNSSKILYSLQIAIEGGYSKCIYSGLHPVYILNTAQFPRNLNRYEWNPKVKVIVIMYLYESLKMLKNLLLSLPIGKSININPYNFSKCCRLLFIF